MLFFAHTDLAYGSYIKMFKKKIDKEKSKPRHAVSNRASISHLSHN